MAIDYDLGGYKVRHRVEDWSSNVSGWEGEGGATGYNTPTEHHYVSVSAKDGNPIGLSYLQNVHRSLDLQLRQEGQVPRYRVDVSHHPSSGHFMQFYTTDRQQLPVIDTLVKKMVGELTYR